MTRTTASASATEREAASNVKPLNRSEMAERLARDIPEGWYVNLGIGIPLLVGNFVPPEREVIFQSENGLLGMGPLQKPGELNTWIVNAGKQNVTLKTGASIVHHADSFAMIRGGHLDLCVLGAFEVAENGDFANWTTSLTKAVPAVGGAMDLAAGAQRVWILMDHTSKDGGSKLVQKYGRFGEFVACSNYPTCEYTSWQRPLTQVCPQCGAIIVADRGRRAHCTVCDWAGPASAAPERNPAAAATPAPAPAEAIAGGG